jgi:hypothetical protein
MRPSHDRGSTDLATGPVDIPPEPSILQVEVSWEPAQQEHMQSEVL